MASCGCAPGQVRGGTQGLPGRRGALTNKSIPAGNRPNQQPNQPSNRPNQQPNRPSNRPNQQLTQPLHEQQLSQADNQPNYPPASEMDGRPDCEPEEELVPRASSSCDLRLGCSGMRRMGA